MPPQSRAGAHNQAPGLPLLPRTGLRARGELPDRLGLHVLVFLVRLLVLILILPLFVMAAFVGLVDGLVRRDVRGFGAGRRNRASSTTGPGRTLMPLAVLPGSRTSRCRSACIRC